MENCTFCQIRDKQIPAKLLFEDEDVMVFPDIHPVRPVHLLIVPKQHVSELFALEDPLLFQKLFVVLQNMIKREGLKDKGYRVVVNGGGAEYIHHLHIHLTGPVGQAAPM
jgi:histidine triad (HIT) family protein